MIASRFSAVSVLSKNFIRSVASRSYSIKAKMEKHEVVPDVIPVAPAEVAKVTFDSGVSCEEGNVLTPTQVKDAPKVEWNADADSYYLLCSKLFAKKTKTSTFLYYFYVQSNRNRSRCTIASRAKIP